MKRVSVGTLRNNLRKFLELAQNGETIEILDRKTPVARLTPIEPSMKPSKGSRSPWMEQLIREGRVRPPLAKLPADFFENIPGNKNARVVDALIEERRDAR